MLKLLENFATSDGLGSPITRIPPGASGSPARQFVDGLDGEGEWFSTVAS